MMALSFRLELRRSRILGVGLAVVVLVYGGVMAVFYPILVANTAAITDYIKLFPKEFMAAFGMTGSLADPGIFFSTYIGSFLWPVVAAIAGIALATRPTAADAERGWSDLPLATPLTRGRYLGAAILGQVVVLGALAFVTVAGVISVGALVGAGFDVARFLAAGAVLWLFACAIAGVASLAAVITLSRSVSASITAGILIAMYLFNIVAQVQPDLAWLGDLSAFRYAGVGPLIDSGIADWVGIGVFSLVALAGWTASLVLFRRRDLLP
jgi:ABC-type transport system involved in multi-copper enzyme maturation permease subunit